MRLQRIIAILWFFVLLSMSKTHAQNLVPNPGFENHINCPSNGGEISFATPWFQPNKLGSSSDLFDACGTSLWGVPGNHAGYQIAYQGNAYAGIILYETPLGNYREYIEVELLDSLIGGKKYCIEFFVNLADTCLYGIDKIGMYFSVDSVLYTPTMSSYVIPFSPQINNTNGVITDKQNWTLVTGEYLAIGGEKFITIGNFFENINTNAQTIGSLDDVPFAYYYIDNVSVVCCDPSGSCNSSPFPPTESSINIPNVFTPNGDGINDVFFIKTTAIEQMSCEIFNRWGVKVAEFSQPNEGWDGRTTSGQMALEGVYYYVLRASNENGDKISKKGFVQLLR